MLVIYFYYNVVPSFLKNLQAAWMTFLMIKENIISGMKVKEIGSKGRLFNGVGKGSRSNKSDKTTRQNCIPPLERMRASSV